MVDYWNKSAIKQASFVNWKALSASRNQIDGFFRGFGRSVSGLGRQAALILSDKKTCKLSKILLFKFKFVCLPFN